ncbi:asparagine synthase (glutamine-hydrolyzing) [Erythrobacter sp. Alg231-14]|uniref:asparagine synthase (glutamine-hydrolyzing) n=1 Tax=Erythrobacter sp. Alg231-14 TaxID=1922225 RepID=UPI000D54F0FA
MCGISGYWSFNGRSVPTERIAAMSRVQSHRGPDGDGVFSNGRVTLANQRLAIIDVENGDQPFVSDDGAVALVQNGEIFNYIELAKELRAAGVRLKTGSDTEVLLHAYRHWGPDFVRRLNGMFAIAIWDNRDATLRLYRDRIGVKPLFYTETGDSFVFASEIKSILAAGIAPQLDPEAIDLFLTFNYVPPPHTAFKGIRHLPPGCMAELKAGGPLQVKRWWSLTQRDMIDQSEAAWSGAFLDLFEDAVRLRLRSDVPFGAFLSGGVDSTSVVGFMARNIDGPVRTFSIGFEDPRFDETASAKLAASRFGTDHIAEIVDPDMVSAWPNVMWHLDQPHGDVSFMPTRRVSELASRHVKVVLTGDGGDELFAGYDKYRNFFESRPEHESDAQFRSAYLANISLFDPAEKARLYRPEFAREVDPQASAELLRPHFDESAHWDRLNQALNVDMQLLLPGNNLVKPDRMGMAEGVEARTPMLDYRMMEFAFTMPAQFKLRDGETKYLFKKAVAPMIGEDLAYRKKQMFTVPIGEWFKDRLAPAARATLLGNDAITRTMFDSARMGAYLDAHVAGRENRTREIRALMAIELWARAFLDTDTNASDRAESALYAA